jgi:hypothetical protein
MENNIHKVTFDGNALNDVIGVDLFNHNFNNYPNKQINIHKLARRSLSIITSSEFTDKNITIMVDICGGSRPETELAISRLKSILISQNGLLEVMNSGILVRWIATLNSFSISWDGTNARCELGFIASTPIGSSVEVFDLFTVTELTANNVTLTEFVSGSYTVEPIITLRYIEKTGTGSFSVYNGKTNQGIEITQTVNAGDIWVINSRTKEVTQNAITRDFNGLFPTWDSGTQSFGYSDTYTSRTVNIDVKYNINIV